MATDEEFRRLARLGRFLAQTTADVPVGVGDDAAVVMVGQEPVVVCTDTLVEGVHFTTDLSGPADVGWKAVAVNVSDLAAMGAMPVGAVVGFNRPPGLSEADIEACYEGLHAAGMTYGAPILGGDTVRATEWSISVTLLGQLEGRQPVRRDGAQVGDVVLVAGLLGSAAAALAAHHRGERPLPEHLFAHRRPQALLATGIALSTVGVHAMIDVSDGIGADAAHIAVASDVSMELQIEDLGQAAAAGLGALGSHAWRDVVLGGGEDFALLATVAPERVGQALLAIQQAGETSAQVIGVVTPAPSNQDQPRVWLHDGGDRHPIDSLGYNHG